MRKLLNFQRDKSNQAKTPSRELAPGISSADHDPRRSSMPEHALHAYRSLPGQPDPRSPVDEQRPSPAELVSPQDSAVHISRPHTPASTTHSTPASHLIPSPPVIRSPSPYSVASSPGHAPGKQENTRDREGPTLKKRPPLSAGPVPALSVLSALDPKLISQSKLPNDQFYEQQAPSDVSFKDEKEKKKGFSVWGHREKFKDKERDKEKERDVRPAVRERTDSRSISVLELLGILAASRREDWALALEICEKLKVSEALTREAVTLLRKTLKHGDPPTQVSAARLWAFMLPNCDDVFISQSSSRKVLELLEELVASPRHPVVRERVLELLAAGAYVQPEGHASRNNNEGFRGLWHRLKPNDQPEEGKPFLLGDGASRVSPVTQIERDGPVSPQAQNRDLPPIDLVGPPGKRKSPSTRNRIIPPEEDIRRLFQECQIAEGNAALLSGALAFAKPEEIGKELTQEFYLNCLSSQDLIIAQIPWATAGAERSHAEGRRSAQNIKQPSFNASDPHPPLPTPTDPSRGPIEVTTEERLLAALLAAHEKLVEVLRVYADLEQILHERRAEEQSRKDVRGDHRRENHPTSQEGGRNRSPSRGSKSSSPIQSTTRSVSPSYPSTPPNVRAASVEDLSPLQQPTPGIPYNLLSPPPAPHGPRSPAPSIPSRAPSPEWSLLDASSMSLEGSEKDQRHELQAVKLGEAQLDEDTQLQPSAKALGKRRVIETPELARLAQPEKYLEPSNEPSHVGTRLTVDAQIGLHDWAHPVHYVYDAAEERTQERIRKGQSLTLVNGVH